MLGRRGILLGTWKGRLVHPFALRPEEIDIEEIAHALAQTCRFGGHTTEFLSVAQHCYEVARLCERVTRHPLTALRGLLHDATEYLWRDLSTPQKSALPAYRRAEHRCQRVIYHTFTGGEPTREQWKVIRYADLIMMATEARRLMPGWKDWPDIARIPILPDWPGPDSMRIAEETFLLEFERLTRASKEGRVG